LPPGYRSGLAAAVLPTARTVNGAGVVIAHLSTY
jgi:hypothetical protein